MSIPIRTGFWDWPSIALHPTEIKKTSIYKLKGEHLSISSEGVLPFSIYIHQNSILDNLVKFGQLLLNK